MAQPVSISAHIERLEAAERRISAIEETKLSSRPMADALSVSWPTLRKWCDLPTFADSGAFVRGGNGIEWEFDPKKTVAALLAHFRGEIARRQDRNRRVVESVGLDMDPDEAGRIDMAELTKQVNLTLAIQENKMKSGGYVPATDLRDFLRGYNQSAVSAVLGVGSKIDPTGALPASIRTAMTEELRKVAVGMQSMCSKFVGEFGAGLNEAGDRGSM
ncbi:MAG: hypothetical protein ACTHNA_14210 [Sphingopyxis terrae]